LDKGIKCSEVKSGTTWHQMGKRLERATANSRAMTASSKGEFA
jgi:hypothetical protein